MNKKNLIILIISAIIVCLLVGGFFVYKNYFQPKKPTEKIKDPIVVLEEIKKIMGMDLNISPQKIKWNTVNGELTLDGKGCSYLDALKASLVTQGFEKLDAFFKEKGFGVDIFNPGLNSNEKNLRRYKKDEVVCNLSRVDNPNNTSLLIVGCGNINKILYHIDSAYALKCNIDSDCDIILDTCKCKIVCRNVSFRDKYYADDCGKTCSVQETNFDFQLCRCANNICEGVPRVKRSYEL